jgi:hypothetical protein
MTEVDLILNVYEATYRAAFAAGYVQGIVAENRFAFRRVVMIINNVANRGAVRALAEEMVAAGTIDLYVFVDEQIEQALRGAGLTKGDLGSIPQYSDWALVAMFVPGAAPWICHWDVETHLREPMDWISPSIRLMEEDERIAVANPNWEKASLDAETLFRKEGFAIGYGFSDQIFLCRRAEFARPIYRDFAPISLRYPFSHLSPIFEQRVDSYMRTHGRLRATYVGAQYVHPNEGTRYPPRKAWPSVKKFLVRAALAGMRAVPMDDPRWKI